MVKYIINKDEIERQSLYLIKCISAPFQFDRDSFVFSFGITDIRTPYGSWGGDITRKIYHLLERICIYPVVLL